MASQWYYRNEHGEQGPFEPQAFKQMAATGQITLETPVRRDDQAEALPAGRVNGLFPAAVASAAPGHHNSAPSPRQSAPTEPMPEDPIKPVSRARKPAGRRAAGARRTQDDPYAPPADYDEEGGEGKLDGLNAVFAPLVKRRGWMIFSGIASIALGGLYLIIGLFSLTAGASGLGGGFMLFQVGMMIAFAAIFFAARHIAGQGQRGTWQGQAWWSPARLPRCHQGIGHLLLGHGYHDCCLYRTDCGGHGVRSDGGSVSLSLA